MIRPRLASASTCSIVTRKLSALPIIEIASIDLKSETLSGVDCFAASVASSGVDPVTCAIAIPLVYAPVRCEHYGPWHSRTPSYWHIVGCQAFRQGRGMLFVGAYVAVSSNLRSV